jgi:hypothetical protein
MQPIDYDPYPTSAQFDEEYRRQMRYNQVDIGPQNQYSYRDE